MFDKLKENFKNFKNDIKENFKNFKNYNQMQKKAFNMIGRISQDFQIIYLSCHEYAVL